MTAGPLTFRVLISALLVGGIAFGNTVQASMSTGAPLTRHQLLSAVIGGVLLALNDMKSRVTPPETPTPLPVERRV